MSSRRAIKAAKQARRKFRLEKRRLRPRLIEIAASTPAAGNRLEVADRFAIALALKHVMRQRNSLRIWLKANRLAMVRAEGFAVLAQVKARLGRDGLKLVPPAQQY